MREIFLLLIFVSGTAIAEGTKSTPTELFIGAIQSRQKAFVEFRDKFYKEEVCPSLDYECVVKHLKTSGIQSSGDIENGVSILSFIIQKKFKKGDCQEICKMNLYAEYSAALVDFLSTYDRNKIFVYGLSFSHPQTKYLVINEELRIFKSFSELHGKLISYRKKIDPAKIFRPELSRRINSIQTEINNLRASELLKGAYLASIKQEDELLKRIVEEGMKNEKERTERRDLVKAFRQEVK